MSIESKIKSLGKGFSYSAYPPDKRLSISNIKDFLGEEFDQEGVAKKTHDLHFDDQNSIYYKKSVEEIIKMWTDKADLSKERGKLVDDFVGVEYDYYDSPDERLNETESIIERTEDPIMKRKYQGVRYAIDYLKKDGMKFETRELPLYLPYEYKGKTYLVNGRFDAIFSKGNLLLLVDWKNNEEIKTENKYQKLKGPCKKLDDCDMNKFTIQLYMYIYMLKKRYKIENPIASCIIQFPGQSDYFYKIHKPSFQYDEKMIESMIEYCIEEKIKKEKAESK